jgi:aryl-alcohol dehydrogenase-like predicted oxidoreductase
MRYVDFSPSASTTQQMSVLGFGCSALMGRAGRSDSLAALSAAQDAGITFFDTARSYGYGQSEAILGEFLEGRRHTNIVCTKFGIVPASENNWKQRIKPLAQKVVRLFPGLRSAARRHSAGQLAAGQFTVEVLQASIETSLRKLRTDYVDILLLHGAPIEVLDQSDLLEAMSLLVQAGKVRVAGLSGSHAVVAELFRRSPGPLTSAQFAMDPASLQFTETTTSPAAQRFLLVGNHPFGGVAGVTSTGARIQQLRNETSLPEELRRKLDPADPLLMPEIVLNGILDGTHVSAVVPAMMRIANLKNNIRAIETCRFTSSELAVLRTLLARPA